MLLLLLNGLCEPVYVPKTGTDSLDKDHHLFPLSITFCSSHSYIQTQVKHSELILLWQCKQCWCMVVFFRNWNTFCDKWRFCEKKWLFKERRCKYLISLLCNTTLLWEFTLLRDLTFSFSWWELDEQISFSVKVKDKYQALTVMPANLAIYRYQKTYQPSGSKT